MTNPVLRKLSQVSSKAEIAQLLEKHIGGHGLNQFHCREAFEQLRKRTPVRCVKDMASLIENSIKTLGDTEEPNWCEVIQLVIRYLRSP